MKVKVGHEEYWVLCLDGEGLHGEPKTIDLSEEDYRRCKAAEDEWEKCGEILDRAWKKQVLRD